MDRFDNLLDVAQRSGSPEAWRKALALVGDTALICRAWLDEKTPSWTAADLLVMTKLVLDREIEIKQRQHATQAADEAGAEP